jgi:hypothetical protein
MFLSKKAQKVCFSSQQQWAKTVECTEQSSETWNLQGKASAPNGPLALSNAASLQAQQKKKLTSGTFLLIKIKRLGFRSSRLGFRTYSTRSFE